MKFKKILLLALAFGGAAAGSGPVLAADYPQKPIEFVVPSSPGGGTDVMTRTFTDYARKYISQPLVVTDKPGASGGIGMGEVQRAAPDGYKVSVLISELAIIPHLNMIKFTSDDFIPIARLNGDPGTITVRADAPWNTVEAFIEHAKKNPGEVKMGNAGAGSIWHLAAAAIEDKTGTKFNHIPFQGAAPSVMGLVGGHVDAITVSPAEVASFVASGKLKVLAIAADQRLSGSLYEKVPTFKERGIDLSLGTWRGLGVPLNTPPETVKVLRDMTRKTAEDPGYKEAMTKNNLLMAYMEGEQFKVFMSNQSAFFKALLAKVPVQK
jgi:tripartite-type tricarboxylate transporter receptor subunit TctC